MSPFPIPKVRVGWITYWAMKSVDSRESREVDDVTTPRPC